MSETDILDTGVLDTGVPMARIAAARVVGPSHLEITWAAGNRGGRTETVDVAPLIGSYKVYRPLRGDAALFATARLIDEGDAIAWDGPDLEMSADLIETIAEQEMDSAEFARFLKRNKLTQEAAAALLGRSRRQIGYYLNPGPVPRIVALACFGYEALAARRRSDAA
ncbi:hypothetical protein RHODGE_RHODGE_00499 [Rhodoplanes serenus]|uniref:HTH cro/C1-type domain-containing protein n=1 Tax=Rhodoplanes serenus TaxID=200615 RepID=A0A447CQD1_9BRAD|nr:hypothetical protein [Rhodoplanes serenus]VCU07403.1 hypothetical protein RHODGE_RHODGE_00499 [Rhodoplanes serenus]